MRHDRVQGGEEGGIVGWRLGSEPRRHRRDVAREGGEDVDAPGLGEHVGDGECAAAGVCGVVVGTGRRQLNARDMVHDDWRLVVAVRGLVEQAIVRVGQPGVLEQGRGSLARCGGAAE